MYLYGYVIVDNCLVFDIIFCNKVKIKIKIRYVMIYEGLVESNVIDKIKLWIWLKDNKIYIWKFLFENLFEELLFFLNRLIYIEGEGGGVRGIGNNCKLVM